MCDSCSKTIKKPGDFKVWHCLNQECHKVFFCDECVQNDVLQPNGVREGIITDILQDSNDNDNQQQWEASSIVQTEASADGEARMKA
jgi:hypothetical protein